MTIKLGLKPQGYARVKRRTSHEPNSMQIRWNNGFCSICIGFGSCDVTAFDPGLSLVTELWTTGLSFIACYIYNFFKVSLKCSWYEWYGTQRSAAPSTTRLSFFLTWKPWQKATRLLISLKHEPQLQHTINQVLPWIHNSIQRSWCRQWLCREPRRMFGCLY